MKEIYDDIKSFLLTKVNAAIDESGLGVPKFSEKFIVFGAVDLTKYTNKLIVSVLPDNQYEAEGDNGDYRTANGVTVSFLVTGDIYENLVSQVCFYSEIFCKCLYANAGLDGDEDDVVIGERKYYMDAGTLDRQMTGVEVNLTIYTSIDI